MPRPPDRSPSQPRRPQAELSDPVLAGLVARARELDALDRTLRGALPPQLANRCRLANVDGSRLVFLAHSPAVAARLRQLQAELFRHAAETTGQRFDKFTVKVAAVPAVPPAAPLEPLSPAASAHLAETARLLADPEMRDLFLRLASLA
jgi:hypothetical protein